MRTKVFLLTCFLSLIFFSSAVAVEEKRVILALFDSSDPYFERADNNLIHNNAEMVLNYLGMQVKFHDVMDGFPSEEEMQGVYGILTWFKNDIMLNPVQYCHWVASQVKKGKRLVMLGNFGAYKDKQAGQEISPDVINEIFNSIGLGYGGDWTNNPFVIEEVSKDSNMVEFERTLKDEALQYERIISLDARNKVYLQITRTDIPNGKSAVVVVTPNGGYAAEGYEVFIDPITDQVRWRIDPFLFFAQAFGLNDLPRYDTTTLFGRRIFYSHIDGDGLRNISEIDRRRICGEVIYDEILKKYALPITVSFIVAEIDPQYYGSEAIKTLAKQMLKLDNVEAGVHGFTHPLDWRRQLTVFAIKGYSRPITSAADLDLLSESLYDKAMIIYVNRNDMAQREIKSPVDYLNQNILENGKRVEVYQWTGDCRPFADAIKLTKALGLRNINGGDSRFDEETPSFTAVAPLSRQDKDQFQPYTSNANDNIYTNKWSGPFYGYKFVIETFEQTEKPTLVKAFPRRLSPINVYYHYYSGEKRQSLGALKEVYDYALKQEIIPVFTSHYAAIVDGFYSGRISSLVDGGWEFKDYGECRTVRFDDCPLYPDLERSKGVLGFCRWENSLYLHLDQGGRATVYLKKEKPSLPYLIQSSAQLSGLKLSRESVSFTSKGFRDAVYKFANLFPGASFRVTVQRQGKQVFAKDFKSGRDGVLEIEVPAKGAIEVQV
ncbi:MAG: hypothetical protein PHG68_06880, partial [Candidatus Omnitrophica bacterium]|nr:hypothetical protein [Candidatus Omnitrophota bacterium]